VVIIAPTVQIRSNSSAITVTNATTSDTGLYQCVATNGADTDMENVTVIVQSEYRLFGSVFCHLGMTCVYIPKCEPYFCCEISLIETSVIVNS